MRNEPRSNNRIRVLTCVRTGLVKLSLDLTEWGFTPSFTIFPHCSTLKTACVFASSYFYVKLNENRKRGSYLRQWIFWKTLSFVKIKILPFWSVRSFEKVEILKRKSSINKKKTFFFWMLIRYLSPNQGHQTSTTDAHHIMRAQTTCWLHYMLFCDRYYLKKAHGSKRWLVFLEGKHNTIGLIHVGF